MLLLQSLVKSYIIGGHALPKYAKTAVYFYLPPFRFRFIPFPLIQIAVIGIEQCGNIRIVGIQLRVSGTLPFQRKVTGKARCAQALQDPANGQRSVTQGGQIPRDPLRIWRFHAVFTTTATTRKIALFSDLKKLP